jgi:hypothetical protein
MPPQATDAEAPQMLESLRRTDHVAVVVVEYLDRNVGIARAREILSHLPVAMADGATTGFELIAVGQHLSAHITKRQHATIVEPCNSSAS